MQALAFVVSDPARLQAFLAASGISAGSIRAAAADPGFLPGVIDHILADESLLLAFAADADIDPAALGRARATLGGPGWERDMP